MIYDVWDKLWGILDSENDGLIVYVYRVDPQGKTISPYLLKCDADLDLPDMLRDDYNGGHFKLLIRKGREMVFSGEINIVSLRTDKA